ncbi:MAG: fumarate hydratase, class [Chloroflexota bacterium]|nr:fumarate hydratase, class [Chloroflexota bacterium]
MVDQQSRTRTERDSMGEMQVPGSALYGASTQRAVLNFPISHLRFNRRFIRALGQIKLAAAEVNRDLGLLEKDKADVIIAAAKEVIDGKWDDEFVIDIFQTGSGTSTNMNANEVIANLAIERLGAERGARGLIHPNDHVNIGQSSNDVIPAAIQLAVLAGLEEDLIPALDEMREVMLEKSQEFWDVIKTGRTHLQDATPIRLGQEFLGYAGQLDHGVRRMRYAQQELGDLPLGGTAVGTGVNSHPDFARLVCEKLSAMNGVRVWETDNHFQAQNTLDALVAASGMIRVVAVSYFKICNDIRWMASGPRAGIFELLLPEVQPGSSIMPGKVNPVIPESLVQVAAHAIGNDTTVMLGGISGNFELNVMMPVSAHNILESVDLLASATRNFTEQCLRGIQATENGPAMVEKGLAICTALAPVIGYDAAAKIAKEAFNTGKTIREIAKERTDLSDADLERILDAEAMTKPGLEG